MSTKKVSDLANNFITKMSNKKPIYYGVFLDEFAHQQLLKWWNQITSTTLLDKPFAHHMTVKFKPSEEDMKKFIPMIGQQIDLKIIGFNADNKGQAVLVKPIGIESDNINPHITISCGAGVSPVYSNDLLSSNVSMVNGPIITGTFDSFPRSI